MLALALVAASVGFSNLAASIGIGAGGADRGTRLRLVVIFGLLEGGMPIIGLAIGHGLAGAVDREARWIAAVLLVAIGGYGVVKAVREGGLRGFGSGRGWERGGRPGTGPGHQGPAGDDPAEEDLPAEGLAGLPRPGRAGRGSVKLLVSGLALSLDNLIAGFALGAFRVSIITGALVFGVVSTLMSLAGLEFGARIGARSGESGELIGGAVLIGVGIAICCGALG